MSRTTCEDKDLPQPLRNRVAELAAQRGPQPSQAVQEALRP